MAKIDTKTNHYSHGWPSSPRKEPKIITSEEHAAQIKDLCELTLRQLASQKNVNVVLTLDLIICHAHDIIAGKLKPMNHEP